MLDNGHFWRNRDLREHVAIIDGDISPTLILKNGTYLNTYTKQWLQAHIWIYNNRIIYVGNQLPTNSTTAEVVDCAGKYLVPGYIEPHAHPFQLYNPEELALTAAKFGTTTLVNDSLMFHFLLDEKKTFSLLEDFAKLPASIYWWGRLDSQTSLNEEEAYFSTNKVLSWLAHPLVIQAGELTSWPRLLDGDDRLLYWIQEAKRSGKPVEGHFPGASEATLTKMKLLGASADHEAMTGKEVMHRLQLGYQVGLRYSSIRPDLPIILKELLAEGIETFDNLVLTTDGSTPGFYKNGLINVCIDIAIKSGVPLEEAYLMATFNPAKHFGLEEQLGSIAPGRIAHINILESKNNPHPTSVLAKGTWIKKGKEITKFRTINWEKYKLDSLSLNWEMNIEDLQFSTPIGLKMVNDVIIKPFAIETDLTLDTLPSGNNDAFLLLIDRDGTWRVNTVINGFTDRLGAMASSYSTTGDFVFIGKSKQDMLIAWKRLKQLGGGIVLVHEGQVIFELPLKLGGIMYKGEMKTLIKKESELKLILKDYGYLYDDPIFNMLVLSATHLPYMRVTQQGIVDVMKREIIFPSIMR